MPQGRIPVLAGPVRMRSARSSRVAGGELSRMRSVPGDRALSRPRKVMQTWRDGAWRWFWGVVAPVVVNRPGADWRAPQNPHKSGSPAVAPTENPRTKRHSPAHGGTAASIGTLALKSLYAGSERLTSVTARVVRRRRTFC